MSIKIADFIKESTTTGGTGDVTLTGLTGFGRFSSAFSVNDTVPYVIENGNNREAGIGTVGVGNTLARTTIHSTLVSGVYNNTNPTAITLLGTSYVYCGPTSKNTVPLYPVSSGTETIYSASTSVVVTHNLGHTPELYNIHVIPTLYSNANKFWITNVTSTEFTINVDTDPGAGTATFAWKVF